MRSATLHAAAAGVEYDDRSEHSSPVDSPGENASGDRKTILRGMDGWDEVRSGEVLDESRAKPRVLLAATDLSRTSHRALTRAALLARHWGSKLALLHVVERRGADWSASTDVASVRLHQHALNLASIAGSKPEVIVRTGSVARSVADVAAELRADLVIVGARRKRALGDLFLDRMSARVLRAVKVPVLLVNRSSTDPYRRLMVATDLSSASSRAAQLAESLNLFEKASVSVVHAFTPFAKGKLMYAGASPEVIATHVKQTARVALEDVVSSLRRDGLNMSSHNVILADDYPLHAIRRAVKSRRSELLVIGTRGHGGFRRVLLGSIAGEVLNSVKCDVLAVPPDARVPGDATRPFESRIRMADLSVVQPEQDETGKQTSGSGDIAWIGLRRGHSIESKDTGRHKPIE